MNPGEDSPTGDFMLPLGVGPFECKVRGLGGAFLASTRIGLSLPSRRTPNSLKTGEIMGREFPSSAAGDEVRSNVLDRFSVNDSSNEEKVGLGSRGGARVGAPVDDLLAAQ